MPFDDHDSEIEQMLEELIDELHYLCEIGDYEEAETISNEITELNSELLLNP